MSGGRFDETCFIVFLVVNLMSHSLILSYLLGLEHIPDGTVQLVLYSLICRRLERWATLLVQEDEKCAEKDN